jgi:L,D-transpeptidase YcbB
MRILLLITFILFVSITSMAVELTGSIRQFFDNKPADSRYRIENDYLFSGTLLPMFYMNRLYAPAWINPEQNDWISQKSSIWNKRTSEAYTGKDIISPKGYELIGFLRKVNEHGLQPTDFHLVLIEKYASRIQSMIPMPAEDIMKLEILLTDAFMLLGSQLHYGKVDPEKEGADWQIDRKESELRLDEKLENALARNDLGNTLNQLAPNYRSYWILKNELSFLNSLNQKSWPQLKSAKAIKPGDTNPILPKIRERLITLRYELSDTTSPIFDEELVSQLKKFQDDRGLNPDGEIGKGTLDMLNTNPEQLINQLKVNMERFRWLPVKLTDKHIIVNIANFRLDLIEGGDTLFSMRTIVGNEYRKTPVFNERMTYIVFSPTWTVPPTILKMDVIPELLKGSGYLKQKNMRLLRLNGKEIDYSEIDWSKISKNRFPYLVQQRPGSDNALGRVKFMFPNKYNIYIHDTPTKGYFARDDRALSSGCIRVQNPSGLAELLLSDLPEWTPEKIEAAMESGTQQTVQLKTTIDVALRYLTAWGDGHGRIQFRKDIYDRDEAVLKALNEKPEPVKARIIPLVRN